LFFHILPLILSALLLAAHYLRSYSLIQVVLCLAAPFLLLIKRRWSLVVLQTLCTAAAFIWLYALYGIIQQRIQEGRSWMVSGIILVLVAIFNLLAGWLLNSRIVKDKYLD
jgi:hypothetical protein